MAEARRMHQSKLSSTRISPRPTFVPHLNKPPRYGLTAKRAKFADVTKLGDMAGNSAVVESQQQDLDRIGEWSMTGQMPFNADKCAAIDIS